MHFDKEDARELFERLGELEIVERNPPRNFVYIVKRSNGETVEGHVVEQTGDGLTLTGNAAGQPVPWDDVASVTISVD